MTMHQFYTVPVGTCVNCGALGRGVIVKREKIDSIMRRIDGGLDVRRMGPGLYRIATPMREVLLMTVRMTDGREEYFADTQKERIGPISILQGDDRERVIKGHVSRQLTLPV